MVFNFGIWSKGGLTFISFSLTMAKREAARSYFRQALAHWGIQ